MKSIFLPAVLMIVFSQTSFAEESKSILAPAPTPKAITADKVTPHISSIVSHETGSGETAIGGSAGADFFIKNKGSTAEVKTDFGLALATSGKTGGLIGEGTLRMNFDPIQKDEKGLRPHLYANMNFFKANPFIRTHGGEIGLELQWKSGKTGLYVPYPMCKADRINDYMKCGFLSGAKLIGEQNLGKILSVKAALEGQLMFVSISDESAEANKRILGPSSYLSASGGVELHLGKHVSIDASAIVETMATKNTPIKQDGTLDESKTTRITPVSGIATATFAF